MYKVLNFMSRSYNNKDLHKVKGAKQDEFYTPRKIIEVMSNLLLKGEDLSEENIFVCLF